jgi:hypothetical protein
MDATDGFIRTLPQLYEAIIEKVLFIREGDEEVNRIVKNPNLTSFYMDRVSWYMGVPFKIESNKFRIDVILTYAAISIDYSVMLGDCVPGDIDDNNFLLNSNNHKWKTVHKAVIINDADVMYHYISGPRINHANGIINTLKMYRREYFTSGGATLEACKECRSDMLILCDDIIDTLDGDLNNLF